MDYFGSDDPVDSECCDARRRALAYAMDDLRGVRDKAVLITIRDQSSLESAIGHAAFPWADVERITLPTWRAPAGVARHQFTW